MDFVRLGGTGEDDNGNNVEGRVLFEGLEHLMARFAGQVQV
jgi:hypothetical protein